MRDDPYQEGFGTVFKITPDGIETVLHDFHDGTVANDGISPVAALVEGADGDFYGTTNNGGANGYGTVFKITPSGVETVLHNFPGPASSSDGFYPQAALVLGSDGNFYGVTRSGGSADKGTIFKITPTGAETILHSFGDGSLPNDGSDPYNALLLGRDGSLYGTTGNGGSAGDGMVYKITTSGVMTVIYSFQGTPHDGIRPSALTFGPDGNFYGTTGGGGAAGDGTVFKITPSGAETIIYSFQTGAGSAGNSPSSLTVGPDGDFYGTTLTGGPEIVGTVFKVTPSGTETTLHSFQDGTVKNDGSEPYAPLLPGTDGNLYGTTSIGGAGNKGNIFEVAPNGTVTTFYSFQVTTLPDDGATPSAGLVSGADGSFYGTTPAGGSANRGTVFKITPDGTETILHAFGDGTIPNDGISPQASLLLGPDGNFYGTTQFGGAMNRGTVFKITPSGIETIVHSFGDGTVLNDGTEPLAALVLGSDGNYYGTTSAGGEGADGINYQGTVFRVTPAGSVTILHDFSNTLTPHDGTNPNSALVLGADGNFYGTTPYGGTTANAVPYGVGDGVVFKVTPKGTETILHVFGDGSVPHDGSKPYAALAVGADGGLYGTTEFGGSGGLGTVFKVTPHGTETILHNFGDGSVPNDGIIPLASLVLNRDGDFYGTASESSVTGSGTVFKITPGGSESVLRVFNDGSIPNDGSNPIAALVQDIYGNFYGTTSAGGVVGVGTIFGLFGPPTTYGASEMTNENTPVTFTVAFSDPSGKGINSIAFPTKPTHGTLTTGAITEANGAGTVTLTYIPAANYIGMDSFTYTVTGYVGTSAPQSVTITVKSPLPTITGFTPISGPVGTPVTITGTNLTGTTVVGFQNAHATSFTVNSAGTQITTTVPIGAATGPIAVLTPGGEAKSATSFTVTASVQKPTITGFTPTSGPAGTVVTITGTNLTGTTVVGFQGQHAKTFTVNSAGIQITTTVPAGAGTGPIAVATPGGTAKSATSFTVIAPPTITGFTPTSGPVGTTVTVTGTNLTGTTVVGFQGQHAKTFTVNSAGTQITATVPTGAATGPIAVLTPAGEAKSTTSFTVTP